jgi:uncharacterized protein (TIGR03437 family)
MDRKRKVLFAKLAIGSALVPVLIWAHAAGPDAGYTLAPGDFGSCTASGCHVGTTNAAANKGSVTVGFANGATTYTPGVKQHLTVTIADPATSQHAWGFELTARVSTDNSTAGTFASTDANTAIMCASANLFTEQQFGYSASTPQTCPATMTRQYMEHSYTGYLASRGATGSASYSFDWTPPATNVGNVIFYVSGNAANGDDTVNGDHIYNKSFTLTPAAAATPPVISAGGVVNGASFQTGIVPGSWFSIFGTNLANTTDTWSNFIVNGKLPTVVDGVSVTVAGQPAVISVVSPTQINAQAPNVGTGPVPVIVTNSNGTSATVTVTSTAAAPAFFLWPGSQVAATRNADGTNAVKPGTFSGVTTTAAKPGDVLILWGTGFGATTPPVAAGIETPASPIANTSPVTMTLGTTNVPVIYAILSPGFAGLYQIAITVPSPLPDGDYPLVATIGGVASPSGVILSVKN